MTATEGHGFVLVQTSSCCPEQYDVYSNGEVIGYLRLRNGYFTVECPDCGGELVYEALPLGDGMFRENEREHFLAEAMKAIMQYCGARMDKDGDGE